MTQIDSPHDTIARAVALLERFREILITEGGQRWVSFVNNVIALGQEGLRGETPAREALENMRSAYSYGHARPGTISDFFVTRASFDEQVAANVEQDGIQRELWDLLGR